MFALFGRAALSPALSLSPSLTFFFLFPLLQVLFTPVSVLGSFFLLKQRRKLCSLQVKKRGEAKSFRLQTPPCFYYFLVQLCVRACSVRSSRPEPPLLPRDMIAAASPLSDLLLMQKVNEP